MSPNRTMIAGAMVLGLMMHAGGLRAETNETSCELWASSAEVKTAAAVSLVDFKYLDISKPIEVTPFLGLVRKGAARKVRIEVEADDPEGDTPLVLVALERDESKRKTGATVRLGVTTRVFDVEDGAELPWSTVRLPRDVSMTEVTPGFYHPLECYEVPGEPALVPRASVVRKDDVNLVPPRSLGDIGKDASDPLGSILGPGPSLSEIGKGSPITPEIPRRSLVELGTPDDPEPKAEPAVPAIEAEETPPPEDIIAPAEVVLPVAETAMCDIYGIGQPLAEGYEPATLQTVGQRSEAGEATLWSYNSIIDQAQVTDRIALLAADPGVIEPLEVVRSFRSPDDTVQHLLRPILPGNLRLADEAPADAIPTLLTVRVFGDARMIGLSGLAALDDTTDALIPAGGLRIVWHDVLPDGTLGAERDFASFRDLTRAAREMPATDVSYSSRTTMQTFANGLADTLIVADSTTDLAIWVLEGVLLPDETPAILSEMIAKVGRDGNIRRFLPGDGRPRRWLHVIAGQFAQTFSESYIRGPVLRADPPIGEVDVERDSSLAERTLLENSDKLGLALTNHINRNLGAEGLPEFVPETETLDSWVQGADAYDSIGILLPPDMVASWLDAVSQSLFVLKRYQAGAATGDVGALGLDLSALLLLKSNSEGRAAGLDPLSAVAGNIEQRLARLETIGLLGPYETLLNHLTNQLVIARAVSPETCGQIFLTLGD